jgi:hypothetical protein
MRKFDLTGAETIQLIVPWVTFITCVTCIMVLLESPEEKQPSVLPPTEETTFLIAGITPSPPCWNDYFNPDSKKERRSCPDQAPSVLAALRFVALEQLLETAAP